MYAKGVGLIRAKDAPIVSILRGVQLTLQDHKELKYSQFTKAEMNVSSIEERANVQKHHLDNGSGQLSVIKILRYGTNSCQAANRRVETPGIRAQLKSPNVSCLNYQSTEFG